MATLANTFYPHVITFSAFPSTPLVFLEDVNVDRAYTITKRGGLSEVAPCFIGASSVSPTITFTTQQIKEVLDIVNVAVLDEGMCADLSAGTVVLWYRAGKNFGFRESIAASNAKHIQCTLALNALLCWNTLTATPEMASLSCMLAAGFKGEPPAEAIQIERLVDEPPAVGCGTPYSLGKVKVSGTEIFGVTNVTWNNNIENRFRTYAGETAPGFLGLDRAEPTVTITTDDASQAALPTLAEGGDILSGAGVEIFLRQRTRQAFYTIAATAAHIKLSALSGLKIVPSISGSPGSVDIICHIQRGAGPPLVAINTAIAIT